ncbi:MAG: DNA-directed RNA polymerase subunit beta' [Anaerolineae bacterium]
MDLKEFNAIRISLASPEEIRTWSHGEVTKPETINYRRLRPEKDGLFCEAIFGPTKDWQCYCGKYKKIRYRGIVCDKCGVEVTRERVRRERMGHIELASPVAHIWYTRRVPSYLGLLLDISRRNLDRVLYFAQYIITRIDEDARQKALRRMEEEAEKELRRARASAEARLGQQRDGIEAQMGERQTELDAVFERLQSERDARVADVMEQTATQREAVKGDKAALAKLEEDVSNQLSDIEADFREERERYQALFQGERDRLFGDLEKELDKINRLVDEQAAGHIKEIEGRRTELKKLEVRQLLTEAEYWELHERWNTGGQPIFQATMGAEALNDIVEQIDLDTMAKEMRHEIRSGKSKQRRKKATKQLKVVEALRKSSNRPEWMILKVLPVIPPNIRPMVQLDGGRFATSDLNDLYRRVINRNNRLKRLLELGAPDVIIRNEKRMLQEAVDSLIDNSRRGKAVSARGRRKLKSLSDMLKGKQGRFRRNLLGKRVDYSGRSVIVIGPHLKLHQCGLPKGMALELFRPFVMRKLVEYGHAHNVKGAKRLIERMDPVVWEVLEEIIEDYPVLLNRAPTLHRLGIQAFQPILVEGNAIQIHPLVCAAFNADFDGDQMAVHVPLSRAAKDEARRLMLASHNLLKPASGEPIVGPSKDMVLGCYYLTMDADSTVANGKTWIFADPTPVDDYVDGDTPHTLLDEVVMAYNLGHLHVHTPITVYTTTYYDPKTGKRFTDGLPQYLPIETTVGRVLFNQILPRELRFVNRLLDKGKLNDLVGDAYHLLGPDPTADLVDDIKSLGFQYATRSGLTIAVADITVPEDKPLILERAAQEVEEIQRQYRRGLITEEEQYQKTVELWTRATDEITEAVQTSIPVTSPLRTMAQSGSTKGGFQPIRQMAGMRGLMADPAGRIIPLPIRSNFREGLTALEYFISTHGARKGLADTALRTADAGYLTRRLVDVAQDAIINIEDCGTRQGIWIGPREGIKGAGESLRERLFGRVTQGPAVNPKTGEVVIEANVMLDQPEIDLIEKAGLKEVYVRSPLTCSLRHGLCTLCYGRDLARGGQVGIGEAVGIIAAQSIGEPGTQLTLRTFHTGGVAGTTDITHGLPRVQELFEARIPKGEALITEIGGRVEIHRLDEGMREIRIVAQHLHRDRFPRPASAVVEVEDGAVVEAGELLITNGDNRVVAAHNGRVAVENDVVYVSREEQEIRSYQVPPGARIRVEENQVIEAGHQLTEGAKNPHRVLAIQGREATQQYLLMEIQKVYRSQGVNINDKHIEIVLRQMLGKVRVKNPGDSEMLPGDLVDRLQFEEINARLISQRKRPATATPILLGITKAALATESFLSAASFQHTINVLADAAIAGKVDELYGLKENVIIGKLIPAGTGFRERANASIEESGRGLVSGEIFDEDFETDFDFIADIDGDEEEEEFEDEDGEFEVDDDDEYEEESEYDF